jgi:ring-1,2-phenylacetyl-CoA epoxidase subunit PaaC
MTTPTVQEFSSPATMTDTCRAALGNLLHAVSDTKLMLGYHYGEWTFGTPELEAAVANCSLSQSELGHVRLLHAILRKHYDVDTDRYAETRAAAEWANVSYLDDDLPGWVSCVAMTYVVDLAVARLLHTMRDSSFAPIRMSIGKIMDEERYHVHHGQGWFRTIAGRGRDERRVIEEAVCAALESVMDWFGPVGEPEDRALVDAGVKSESNADIMAAVIADIKTTADPLGVDLGELLAPSFKGWTPQRRRSTASTPSERILTHLRGSKNEIFKMT